MFIFKKQGGNRKKVTYSINIPKRKNCVRKGGESSEGIPQRSTPGPFRIESAPKTHRFGITNSHHMKIYFKMLLRATLILTESMVFLFIMHLTVTSGSLVRVSLGSMRESFVYSALVVCMCHNACLTITLDSSVKPRCPQRKTYGWVHCQNITLHYSITVTALSPCCKSLPWVRHSLQALSSPPDSLKTLHKMHFIHIQHWFIYHFYLFFKVICS